MEGTEGGGPTLGPILTGRGRYNFNLSEQSSCAGWLSQSRLLTVEAILFSIAVYFGFSLTLNCLRGDP